MGCGFWIVFQAISPSKTFFVLYFFHPFGCYSCLVTKRSVAPTLDNYSAGKSPRLTQLSSQCKVWESCGISVSVDGRLVDNRSSTACVRGFSKQDTDYEIWQPNSRKLGRCSLNKQDGRCIMSRTSARIMSRTSARNNKHDKNLQSLARTTLVRGSHIPIDDQPNARTPSCPQAFFQK